MVKSDICWMSEVEKGDCKFDHGGYFIVKGAEKVDTFPVVRFFDIFNNYICKRN